MRNPVAACGAALALACVAGVLPVAFAQPAWPAKSMRIVIPFPPGGPTDIIGRAAARKLEEAYGHAAVIENRGGAGGTKGVGETRGAPGTSVSSACA